MRAPIEQYSTVPKRHWLIAIANKEICENAPKCFGLRRHGGEGGARK
jgi:hypothetical protein